MVAGYVFSNDYITEFIVHFFVYTTTKCMKLRKKHNVNTVFRVLCVQLWIQVLEYILKMKTVYNRLQ
jgi:hypothetical protein